MRVRVTGVRPFPVGHPSPNLHRLLTTDTSVYLTLVISEVWIFHQEIPSPYTLNYTQTFNTLRWPYCQTFIPWPYRQLTMALLPDIYTLALPPSHHLT